jgi:oligopeptide transport system substrate-binding protein
MVDAETGLKMFTSGEIDWEGSPFSVIPLDALASLQEKKMIETHPLLGTYWIRVNTEIAPFHTEELRKSLALAINREEIVTHIVEGVPATGIVPASFGLQDSPYFCDGSEEEAASFFNAALQKEKLTIEKLPEITLTYIADTKNHRIAQIIQDQWYKVLQISINLEPLERKVYFDRVSKGDFQLACGSWVADFRDPINFLEVFKSKNIGTNNTHWESLDYQKALEASYSLLAPSERKEALKKTEEILMAEMPVIPIFHYTMLNVKQNRLKDVVLTDAGHIDFKWASFVE